MTAAQQRYIPHFSMISDVMAATMPAIGVSKVWPEEPVSDKKPVTTGKAAVVRVEILPRRIRALLIEASIDERKPYAQMAAHKNRISLAGQILHNIPAVISGAAKAANILIARVMTESFNCMIISCR